MKVKMVSEYGNEFRYVDLSEKEFYIEKGWHEEKPTQAAIIPPQPKKIKGVGKNEAENDKHRTETDIQGKRKNKKL